jgi:sec-independent protein translocase protein TatA
MPFGISLPELLILLVVLLLVFGAKRLPEMGRSLGKGMREFKDGISGLEDDVTSTKTTAAPAPAPPQGLPASTSEPVAHAPASAPAAEERETVR